MPEQAYDPIPLTAAEALQRWDANEVVFSVEMGGIGPGYEMAIQGLAFEMMRELTDEAIPAVGNITDAYAAAIEARLDAVVSRCNILPWGGFSGAQVGAAKSLACIVIQRGYRAALGAPGVKDRLIQVCKRDLRVA